MDKYQEISVAKTWHHQNIEISQKWKCLRTVHKTLVTVIWSKFDQYISMIKNTNIFKTIKWLSIAKWLLINHSNQISHDPRKMTIIWQIQNKPRVNNCKQQRDTWFNVDDKRTKHKINPFFAQKGKVDCCFLEQILFSFTLLIVLSCSADILCDLREESGQYANDWHFAWAGYPEISFVIPLYCDIYLQAIQWTF